MCWILPTVFLCPLSAKTILYLFICQPYSSLLLPMDGIYRCSKMLDRGIYEWMNHLGFLFFWLRLTACGILVPWPGIELRPPAVKAPRPNHWTARKLPHLGFLCPSFWHFVGQIEMKLQCKTTYFCSFACHKRDYSWNITLNRFLSVPF